MRNLLGVFFLSLSLASAAKLRLISDPFEASTMRNDLFDQLKPGDDFYFSVYSVKENFGGLYFLAKMYEAAKRGVNVVILLDHQRAKIPLRYIAALNSVGAKVYFYNPSYLAVFPTYNHRLHDKLWVFNNLTLLTDANLSSMYFGMEFDIFSITKSTPYSRHLLVDDPSFTANVKAHIQAQIQSRLAKRVTGGRVSESKKKMALNHFEHLLSLASEPFAQKFFHADWRAQPELYAASIEFLHDTPGKKNKSTGAMARLLQDIRAAKKSVLLESAYVVPTPELIEALKEILNRNLDSPKERVPVIIVTSHESGLDNSLVAMAWAQYKKDLIKLGAQIIETDNVTPLVADSKRPARVHAKGAVIDDFISYISTANLDGRSQNINSEVAARIVGIAFAAEYKKHIFDSITRLKMNVISIAGKQIDKYPPRLCKGVLKRLFYGKIVRHLPEQL